jgi:hypothetical protein
MKKVKPVIAFPELVELRHEINKSHAIILLTFKMQYTMQYLQPADTIR